MYYPSSVAEGIEYFWNLTQESGHDVGERRDGMNLHNLPKYKSHKVVSAALVGLAVLYPDNGDGQIDLYLFDLETGDYLTRVIKPEAWYNTRIPSDKRPEGGVFVVYEDDYTSWSPREAFEKGYSRIEEDIEGGKAEGPVGETRDSEGGSEPDIIARLQAHCFGDPAKIPWPHVVLHDAMDEIRKLRAEVRLNRGVVDRQQRVVNRFGSVLVFGEHGQWAISEDDGCLRFHPQWTIAPEKTATHIWRDAFIELDRHGGASAVIAFLRGEL